MARDLADWLGSQGPDFLSSLLRSHPDVLHPPPRSLRDLANRLSTPGFVAAAMVDLDGAAWDALVALRTFDDVRTRDGLARLAGIGEQDTGDRLVELDRALRQLATKTLVWPAGDGRLRLTEPLQHDPGGLNLGRRLRPLLDQLRAGTLTAMAQRLGLGPGERKADTMTRLENSLADPAFVRGLLEVMPARTREAAEDTAWHGPRAAPDCGYVRTPPGPPDYLAWLAERGLLLPEGGEFGRRYHLLEAYEMPREVALALRGPGYRVPLRSRPEPPHTLPHDIAEVDRAALAAAMRFVDGMDRLVELSASDPPRTLKAGGVGVRELARLSTALQADKTEVRLWLEVAQIAGLLEYGEAITPGPIAADWRANGPAERFVQLLTAWWLLPESPWIAAAADKPDPALLLPEQPSDRFLRQDLLGELQHLPAGACPQEWSAVDEIVAWRRPAIHTDANTIAEPATLLRRECAAVGALALGAASSFGRGLASGDTDLLRRTATDLMPRAQHTVLLQADLTATVTGPPSAAVADTLHRMATAESRGTASVWRFGPASVRNALDHGYTADELVEQLAALSDDGLPQPLEYLIRDTARRFGELAVATVSCCVLSEDPNLITEVGSHRGLRDLGLRVLAPTVLASRSSAGKTLQRLRDAGYEPELHDEHGAVQLKQESSTPSTSGAESPLSGELGLPLLPAADIDALVDALLNTAGQHDEEHTPAVERELNGNAGSLSPGEQRILAHAIETAMPVHIHYVDQSNKLSRRTITPLEYFPPWIRSFCHLRQAERDFRLERIRAVSWNGGPG